MKRYILLLVLNFGPLTGHTLWSLLSRLFMDYTLLVDYAFMIGWPTLSHMMGFTPSYTNHDVWMCDPTDPTGMYDYVIVYMWMTSSLRPWLTLLPFSRPYSHLPGTTKAQGCWQVPLSPLVLTSSTTLMGLFVWNPNLCQNDF